MDKILSFILGAAVGSLVTYKIVEKKFKNIADEEIESVKEKFKERKEEIEFKLECSNKEEKRKEGKQLSEIFKNYKNILKEYDGKEADLNEDIKEDVQNIEIEEPEIDIIPSDEFGELDGYDEHFWLLYNNDILVDEFNKIVNDKELYIGKSLDLFDDDDSDDTIYIRNHNTCIDYEIIKVDEDYEEDTIEE